MLLSRVAESIYWMNRYIERAENVARFLDVNHNLTLGDSEGLADQWLPLVYTTGDEQLFHDRHGDAGREQVVQFLTTDKANPNSIYSCVAQARENARSVREIIPNAMWEQLNKFYLLVRAGAESADSLGPLTEFCDQVKIASHTLLGLTYATMSHGEPWHFSRIGRLIERADKTSRIIDVQYYLLLPPTQEVGQALDVIRWSALLKSASALEMYRRTHGRIVPERVADFLILDRLFPRAIHFCLVHAQESLRAITGSAEGTFRYRSEQAVGRLRADVDYARIEDIIRRGMHEFLDDLQIRLNQIGDAIDAEFFITSYAPSQRQQQS